MFDNSRPRLLVDCREETYRGVRLVVVEVRADEIYADAPGRAPDRIGTDCLGMVEREILDETSQAQRGPSVEYGPKLEF